MTAFAFDILAALTGPGSRPGVAASGAQADGALGGAFEALLAGLVAQQGEGAAEQAAVVPTTVAASTLAPRIAPSLAAPLVDEAEAETVETDELSNQDLALAGAEALVVLAAPAAEITIAATPTDAETAPVAAVAAKGSVDIAPEADIVPAPAELTLADPAAPASDEQPVSDPARASAAPGDATVPTPAAPYVRKALPKLPEDGVQITAPATQAEAPAQAQAEAAAPPVEPQAGPAAKTVAALPELVSLAARVVEPKAAEARATESSPTAKAEAAEAPTVELAEVAVEGIQEVVAETPVETPAAAEAVAVETAAVDLPETPAPATPASRRSTRADARTDSVISAGKVEALEPGLKAVARTDSPTAVDALLPAADEPVAAPVVAEAEIADDASTTHAPIAQPTTHAAHTAAADAAAVVRGSPETVAKLASDIVRKLEGQNTKFDLQLDPFGLGKVDVTVEINADGRLTAALSFETAQAADALRGRASELRQALEKAGFDLTDSSLSFDMNNQGGGAERQQAGERFADWSSRTFQSVQSGLDQADALLAAATYARSPNGGVDIRI